MSSRNQNRPPRSPSAKKDVGEVPVDKRRRIGAGRPGGATSGTRKPLAAVNKKSDSAPTNESGSVEELDCAEIEFTREEVEALIKQKPKMKKFDHKGNMETLNELMNKLRLCIKWSLRNEEIHMEELGKLKAALEAAEKKYLEIEGMMKEETEKSCATISELVKEKTSLQEKLAKEEAEKLDAINCHQKEKEARVASEDRQASLSRDLEIARQDLAAVNKQVATLDDTYKRLQEYNLSLQQYNGKLHGDLETAHGSLQRVEKEKASIMETLSTLRGQLSLSRASEDEASKQKEALAKEVDHLRAELHQVRDDRDRQVSHIQSLTTEVTQLKEVSGKSIIELGQLIEKTKTLEETCSSQKETINLLEHQLRAAKEKLKVTDLTATETRTECEEKTRVLQELQERLAEKEHQLIEGEKLRKKLHNTILELKGNIRVFCRVRPLLPDDGAGTEMQVIAYPTSTEALGRGIDVVQNGQKFPFTFDKVFDHESSQHDVFVEISQLVQSALDGYKVCIFAYGQTGSGKTYTMMGRPEAADQKGLIPRSLEQIFETSQSLKAQGWKFKMQASMLEIYNETIRDLLGPSRSSSDNSGAGKQYNIKHDASGNTHVTDLTIVDVSSIQEISSLLRQAAQSRSVSKTLMNEQSSRSHFVFTLRISGVNEGTEQQVQGVLNLIDLAGSERLSRSGATGDRLKETQAINKSLSCLSDVIFALARKDDHVPFRNSKLTYLLQPCLGGDSKTLMFVNISPDPVSVGESLCSLRFAARVNACEIGVPRRQMSLKAAESRLSYG